MGYWTEVKDVFKKGVNLAGEGIKEGAETVIGAAKDGVHIVELNKDLFLKQREYHTAVTELGEVVMDLHREGKSVVDDDSFKDKLQKAKDKEKECRDLEAQIKTEKKKEEDNS